MKLVKYIAGDFDLTCEPKECPAIIVSVSTQKVGNEEIEVANLVIFQGTGDIIERRENVPYVDDKREGKDGKSVHAYFEEYPEVKTSNSVSLRAFNELESELSDLKKVVELLKPTTPAQ